MPKLKDLIIKKVDFVPEGANPDADVMIFKRRKNFTKSAKSFTDNIKIAGYDEVYRQIWDFSDALTRSLISILSDDDIKNKSDMMNKSLDEFYGAAGCSIENWSEGKVGDYIIDITEKNNEAVESIVKGLAADKNKNLIKGDVSDMKFEDIDVNKLTAEEAKQLKAIAEKAGVKKEENNPTGAADDKKTKAEQSTTKEGGSDGDKHGIQTTEDGKKDDVYKGLHPAVAQELDNLKKFREETELKEIKSVAKKYEVIGKKPEELAPLLKSLKDAGGSAYDDMISVLDSTVEAVNKSRVFEEVGRSGHNNAEDGAVIAKAKKMAAEIKKSNQNLSDSQAMAQVWQNNPELMNEYDNEIGGE